MSLLAGTSTRQAVQRCAAPSLVAHSTCSSSTAKHTHHLGRSAGASIKERPKPVRLPPIAARQRRSPVIAPDIAFRDGDQENYMDLFQYLLRNRIVMVSGFINDKISTQVVGSLLALEALDEDEEIRLYINSPGGSPYAVLGVVDTLLSIKCPVSTVAMGAVYSYSSLLLAAGNKGKRYAMKNTRIMMTQPSGGSQGSWYQIEKTVQELNALYQLYCRYYMKCTGMDQTTVELNTCRDFFMTPEDALDHGLIDDVIAGKDDVTPPPSMVRALRKAGILDDLSEGILRVDCL